MGELAVEGAFETGSQYRSAVGYPGAERRIGEGKRASTRVQASTGFLLLIATREAPPGGDRNLACPT